MTGLEYERVQAKIDFAALGFSKQSQIEAIIEALRLLLMAMPIDDYED